MISFLHLGQLEDHETVSTTAMMKINDLLVAGVVNKVLKLCSISHLRAFPMSQKGARATSGDSNGT